MKKKNKQKKVIEPSFIDVLDMLDDEPIVVPPIQVETKSIANPPKKRGRPTLGEKAKSPSMRQRDLRNSYEIMVSEKPSNEWTDAQCRFVLNSKKWRGTKIYELAWRQLGILHKFS